MTNINELCQRLLVIAERGGKSADQLSREERYVSETIQKTQSLFADQTPGQALIRELYSVITTLSSAETAANALRNRIEPYMAQVKK